MNSETSEETRDGRKEIKISRYGMEATFRMNGDIPEEVNFHYKGDPLGSYDEDNFLGDYETVEKRSEFAMEMIREFRKKLV